MKSFCNRRRVGAWLAATSLLAVLPALAQDYPSRPLRLMVGYAAGGPVDVNARLLAALRDPVYQKALADGGFEVANQGPDAMVARVNAESRQWGELIKTLKLN